MDKKKPVKTLITGANVEIILMLQENISNKPLLNSFDNKISLSDVVNNTDLPEHGETILRAKFYFLKFNKAKHIFGMKIECIFVQEVLIKN